MKTRAKAKRRSSHARRAPAPAVHRSRKPAPVRRSHVEPESNTFTPMETGSPDRDEGRGPLGQEGEGEAQNDQLAALEEVEPDLKNIPET